MNRETVVDGVKTETATGAVAGIDATQGHELTYDTDGNRTSDTYAGTEYVTGNADNGGNGKTVTATDGGITTERYSYNSLDQLTQMSRDGLAIESLGYDAAGHEVVSNTDTVAAAGHGATAQAIFDSPMQDEVSYFNTGGQLSFEAEYYEGQESAGASSGTTAAADVQYQYDGAGNLIGTRTQVNTPNDYHVDLDSILYRVTTGYQQVLDVEEQETSNNGNAVYAGGSLGSPNITETIYDSAGNVAGAIEQYQSFQNGNGKTTAEVHTIGQTERVINDAEGEIVSNTTTSYDFTGTSGSNPKPTVTTSLTHTLIDHGQVVGSSGSLQDQSAATFGQSFTTLADAVAAQGNSAGSYVVQNAGETFQSIAQALWGDPSQWYRIAQANNLPGDATLSAGQVLALPAAPSTVSDDYATSEPYNPATALGAPVPDIPPPPPTADSSGCSGAAMIVALIAAVVAAIVAPELLGVIGETEGGLAGADAAAAVEAGTDAWSTASLVETGAIAGASGALAGQVAGNALGVEDGFSLKGIAEGAIGGAIGGALSNLNLFGGDAPAVGSPQQIVNVAARQAIGSALTQGVAVVTHLQPRFDWSAVAAAGLSAGGAQALDDGFGIANVAQTPGVTAGVENAATQLVAGSVAKTLVNGKESYAQVAGDAFGNALGNSVVQQTQPTSPTREMKDDDGEEASLGESFNQSEIANIDDTGWDTSDESSDDTSQNSAQTDFLQSEIANENQTGWGGQKADTVTGSNIPGVIPNFVSFYGGLPNFLSAAAEMSGMVGGGAGGFNVAGNAGIAAAAAASQGTDDAVSTSSGGDFGAIVPGMPLTAQQQAMIADYMNSPSQTDSANMFAALSPARPAPGESPSVISTDSDEQDMSEIYGAAGEVGYHAMTSPFNANLTPTESTPAQVDLSDVAMLAASGAGGAASSTAGAQQLLANTAHTYVDLTTGAWSGTSFTVPNPQQIDTTPLPAPSFQQATTSSGTNGGSWQWLENDPSTGLPLGSYLDPSSTTYDPTKDVIGNWTMNGLKSVWGSLNAGPVDRTLGQLQSLTNTIGGIGNLAILGVNFYTDPTDTYTTVTQSINSGNGLVPQVIPSWHASNQAQQDIQTGNNFLMALLPIGSAFGDIGALETATSATNSTSSVNAAGSFGVGSLEEGTALQSRAQVLNGMRDSWTAERGTTSVVNVQNVNTEEVQTWIATESKGPMPSEWTGNLQGNEQYIQGFGHAEETLVNALGDDWIITSGGTSRNICIGICQAMLEEQGLQLGGPTFPSRPDKSPFRIFWRE
jgi:LysM repeat protein